MNSTFQALSLALAVGLTAGGCTHSPAKPAADAAAVSVSVLEGTRWRLHELQSMDDAKGTTTVADPESFTMDLQPGGVVSMRLGCNSAQGNWTAEPATDSTSGKFAFGPLAMTRAMCPPPNIDERVAMQSSYVRSYLLKDERLYLSLMADGGIQVWEAIPE